MSLFSGCVQPYTVTLEQVGSNVVATGSGAINLTGLSYGGSTTNSYPFIMADGPRIVTGSKSSFDYYTGATGPTRIGSGPYDGDAFNADAGSGDAVGIDINFLRAPVGYTSYNKLSSSATWNGKNLSGSRAQNFDALGGVMPGTYVWTWGIGLPNQKFTLIIKPP